MTSFPSWFIGMCFWLGFFSISTWTAIALYVGIVTWIKLFRRWWRKHGLRQRCSLCRVKIERHGSTARLAGTPRWFARLLYHPEILR